MNLAVLGQIVASVRRAGSRGTGVIAQLVYSHDGEKKERTIACLGNKATVNSGNKRAIVHYLCKKRNKKVEVEKKVAAHYFSALQQTIHEYNMRLLSPPQST